MAMTLYKTDIYDANGSRLLWEGALEKAITITITSGYLDFYASDQFTGRWSPNAGTILGLSTHAGTTTPEYPAGTTFTTAQSDLALYVLIEGGGGSKTLRVKYGSTTLFQQEVSGSVTKSTKDATGHVMEHELEIAVY